MWKKIKVWLAIIGGILAGVSGVFVGRRYSHRPRVGGTESTNPNYPDGTKELGKRASNHQDQARRDGTVVRDSVGRAESASSRLDEAARRLEDIIAKVEQRRK